MPFSKTKPTSVEARLKKKNDKRAGCPFSRYLTPTFGKGYEKSVHA
jgi:hypothetical protein